MSTQLWEDRDGRPVGDVGPGPRSGRKPYRKRFGVKLTMTYTDSTGRERKSGWTSWYADRKAQNDALTAKGGMWSAFSRPAKYTKEKVFR